ncbi:hypothetical protein CYMTET_12940 [Cymbomonas tetramitiformis]|uniref:Orn/Lys/Arg decarboxylases family 1 pyridoxal-P attachment site domain-containing protein n=1 Tax=Cymbomonas tetramitiformis TaxID=36881 RepID=A0AAE0LBC5_9CHLO|nr:hypothetical protein CYMTET_12940 [Cymbomonas tetramitiformis]
MFARSPLGACSSLDLAGTREHLDLRFRVREGLARRSLFTFLVIRGAHPAFLKMVGSKFLDYDLTELSGLDFLGSPTGVIKNAQELAAEAFGAERTWFLVNGTTVGIHAAFMATCRPGDTVLLARNCHQSTFSACILAGVDPAFVELQVDQSLGVAHAITVESVALSVRKARADGRRVTALMLVSPSYYGACRLSPSACQARRSASLGLVVVQLSCTPLLAKLHSLAR